MAINIGENTDGYVTYQNPPVNRTLFPNIKYATPEEISDLKQDLQQLDTDKADVETVMASFVTDNASGAVASFPDGADGIPVDSLIAHIEPVQSGSGDPSPENIRPISGWTGANVSRTGVNLIPNALPSNVIAGTIDNSGVIKSATNARVCAILVPKNTDIYVQKKGDDTTSGNVALGDTGNISVGTPTYNYAGFTNVTYVSLNTGNHAWLYISSSSADALSLFWTTRELMVHVGTERKTYVAPLQQKYVNVDWTTEAGTVYGGTLDVVSGVLTVDRVKRTLTGAESSWTQYDSSSQHNYYMVSLGYNRQLCVAGSGVCTHFPTVIITSSNDAIGCHCADSTPLTKFGAFFRWDMSGDFDTLEKFKTYVAEQYSNNTPVEVCFKVIEGTTYQLTAQEVNTLLGQNNIWADTGDTDVTYKADTKLYIQKLTAPTEDDMVANNNIASGVYFMVGNTLYLSTAVIAQGDAIIPGTNCTQTDLASALNAINA